MPTVLYVQMQKAGWRPYFPTFSPWITDLMQVDLTSCRCDKMMCAWGTIHDNYAVETFFWMWHDGLRYISIYGTMIYAQHEKVNIILPSEFDISEIHLHLFSHFDTRIMFKTAHNYRKQPRKQHNFHRL